MDTAKRILKNSWKTMYYKAEKRELERALGKGTKLFCHPHTLSVQSSFLVHIPAWLLSWCNSMRKDEQWLLLPPSRIIYPDYRLLSPLQGTLRDGSRWWLELCGQWQSPLTIESGEELTCGQQGAVSSTGHPACALRQHINFLREDWWFRPLPSA